MNPPPDMEDPQDYAAAFAELKDILSALQQDEIGVDALAEKVKRAAQLISYCGERLRSTENEVQKVLDELGEEGWSSSVVPLTKFSCNPLVLRSCRDAGGRILYKDERIALDHVGVCPVAEFGVAKGQGPQPTVYGPSTLARAAAVEETVARQWNEVLLEAIRGDFARPTVHARNLFHSSVLAFDAFAAYDTVDAPLFLGQMWQGMEVSFNDSLLVIPPTPAERTAAQETAISHAIYRLLSHRFATSPGHEESQSRFDDLMAELGHDAANVSIDYAVGPAELGNYLADRMIAFGLADGANEAADYANLVYEAINPDLELAASGNDALIDPNAWQPLAIPVFVDQSGNVLSETPDFQGAEWGQVAPFALSDSVRQDYERDGHTWPVYLDCGAPPLFQEGDLRVERPMPMRGFALVALWSGHLDQEDDDDVYQPRHGGNPRGDRTPSFADMDTFYDWVDGGDVAHSTREPDHRIALCTQPGPAWRLHPGFGRILGRRP